MEFKKKTNQSESDSSSRPGDRVDILAGDEADSSVGS